MLLILIPHSLWTKTYGFPETVNQIDRMENPAMMQAPQPFVVTQQPGAYPPQTITNIVINQSTDHIKPRQWSSGLCGCFEDICSCCLGYFFPCCFLMSVSQRAGEGCCFPCCCPGALLSLRIKIRVEQNIQGSLCSDYCAVCCCPQLVLCQLSRELKNAGR